MGSLAESCESLGVWQPLATAISAWRGTARAWASGLADAEVAELDPVAVERP